MAAKKKRAKRKVEEPDDDELEAPEPPAAPPAAPAAAPKRGRGKAPVELGPALLEAFATSERINQYLLEHLDAQAWSALAPVGKGRTIRGIFAHLHNVRLLWLSVSAPDLPAPPKVERDTLTVEQAQAALKASADAMLVMLRRALESGGHLKDFKPDVVGFTAYAVAHEAHHRGQVCLLARMLGVPLEPAAGYGLWEWRKRWAEIG